MKKQPRKPAKKTAVKKASVKKAAVKKAAVKYTAKNFKPTSVKLEASEMAVICNALSRRPDPSSRRLLAAFKKESV